MHESLIPLIATSIDMKDKDAKGGKKQVYIPAIYLVNGHPINHDKWEELL